MPNKKVTAKQLIDRALKPRVRKPKPGRGMEALLTLTPQKEHVPLAKSQPQADVYATLAQRGAVYGEFKDHATVAMDLKDRLRATPGWPRLTRDKQQALDVICDKIARILTGEPEYADNFHDIAGYARLCEARIGEPIGPSTTSLT